MKTSLSRDSGKGGSGAGMSEAARQSLHAAGYGLRSGAIADLYRKEGLTDTSSALLACLCIEANKTSSLKGFEFRG